ncbi:MAG: hypothetical protein EOO59_11370 [Hymenobacter sp.]|nr:MAG: hypothetical protein EOO59_11370 [Hymenobacter sp.]
MGRPAQAQQAPTASAKARPTAQATARPTRPVTARAAAIQGEPTDRNSRISAPLQRLYRHASRPAAN